MNKLIDRDWRNARLFKPNIRISDKPPRKPGIYQSASEWLFALFAAGVFWFLLWVGVQLWRFLAK